MKLGARILAIMAAAFVLVPALYANDAAKPNAETVRPATDVSAPATAPEAQPQPAKSAPARSSARSKAESEPAALPAGKAGYLGAEGNFPKVEWFLGYSFWRAMPTSSSNRMGYLHGGSTSVAYNFNSWLGLVGDFGGYGNSRLTLFSPGVSQTVDSNGSAYTFLFGPRFSYRRYERLTPFAEVLLGGTHASPVTISGCTGSPNCTPLGSENAFATVVGAGLDIKLSHHIALRLIEADFLLTHFKDPFSIGGQEDGWQDNIRLSSGIVFRFGGNPPPPPVNHAPTASCSIDKGMVYVDSGDTAAVTATASDPDNDTLTYTWSANGGSVDGTGPRVRWISAGAAAGAYSITAHIDDGRGGTATCSADIRVDPKPNSPPTIACSADRSSVFVGERVHITTTASDPDGDRLTYAWRANAGQVAGSGAAIDFDTSGLAPGNYSVTARVDDGRGGAADCSATIEVKAVPPPPLASKINECAFGKPLSARIDNVCKRILDDVALRLQNEPRATAVIIGYSDPKGRKSAQVAQDRAGNAVKYLGEKGIDASRVNTRTGNGQAGATDNRRIDVIWVPEGATY